MIVLHQLRYDLLALWRNRRARFFTMTMPIIFLVVFAGVFGDSHTVVNGVRVKTSDYYVPGIMALTIVTSSLIALVTGIATEREKGILKRRRATPVPAWVLVAGRTLSSVAMTFAVLAVLLVIARLGYDVTLPLASVPALVATVLVGTAAFSCLAYALAAVVGNAEAAQPLTQAITLPLYFVSGVWIPADDLPEGLRRIGQIFPIEHLSAALHSAFVPGTGGRFAAGDLLVLALWGVGGALVAVRRFSWLPAGAPA
jgi:ABC-2 type transport system permease protein